nr:immunoglobulin light chain junction region [Macaca mulatta]
CMQSLEFLLTF